MFYKKLIDYYLNLKFPIKYKELSKIDKYINWNLSENDSSFISCKKNDNKNIVEFDIKGAFPTICNNIISDSNFLNEMNKFENKKDKNIFIATNLSNEQLKNINYICKIISFGIIFDIIDESELKDIIILEIKKDSCIFICNNITLERLNLITEQKTDFTEFLLKNNFQFHITFYDKYFKTNGTSYFLNKDELIIKGIYKHIPEFLFNECKDFYSDKKLLNKDKIEKIYTYKNLNLIYKSSIKNSFNYFFKCGDKFLVEDKYENNLNINKINPLSYLRYFVYPFIIFSVIN